MEGEKEKSIDFYAVLGLKKECSALELKNAYRKLALKWHPDRLSASGTPKCMEEANKRFQAIQQAYSVLVDANKRFLYDVGVYDCNDDEDEKGMGDFLNEMAEMMNQNKSNEHENDRFEELQELFDKMFQDERAMSTDECPSPARCSSSLSSVSSCRASFATSTFTSNNKRESSEMSSFCNVSAADSPDLPRFCIGSFQVGVGSSRAKSIKKGRR